MSKGYVIVAVDGDDDGYTTCASVLCDSLHRAMPDARVTLLTNRSVSDSRWDQVITIEDTDRSNWKLSNDPQAYWLSPYEYTVKLEADMYVPRSIDWWWDALEDRDLHIATTIRNHRGEISGEKFYRRTFTENRLPDTYNAITYFRKSKLADEFYGYVGDIFQNWPDWVELLKYSSEDRATTDVVYAIASRIVGEEYTTMPHMTDISMAHMKPQILGTITQRWYEQLPWELSEDVFRIASFPQMYPVHYWCKEFAGLIGDSLK